MYLLVYFLFNRLENMYIKSLYTILLIRKVEKLIIFFCRRHWFTKIQDQRYHSVGLALFEVYIFHIFMALFEFWNSTLKVKQYLLSVIHIKKSQKKKR